MENKKIMAFVLTGALASGTLSAGSTVLAVDDSTDYVLTIPATLAVENPGWNATDGITAKVKDGDTFDSNKKLTVTASSGDAFALVSGENTISYSLATEENGAANTTWEFSAAELNETNGTNKSMGINIENYSTKPAGNYQDTVTFTAEVKNAVIPVSSVTLSQSTLELTAGGDSSTLTASVLPINATNKTITWNSSNPSVATVVNGVVTPISAGTTNITATADGITSAACSVTVNSAVTATLADAFENGAEISISYHDYWRDKTSNFKNENGSISLVSSTAISNLNDTRGQWDGLERQDNKLVFTIRWKDRPNEVKSKIVFDADNNTYTIWDDGYFEVDSLTKITINGSDITSTLTKE